MSGSGVPPIPRWAWVGAGLLVVVAGIAAALLYVFLPPGTASFLLFAGAVVSMCGAGPVLLGAYSRHKAQQQARAKERAEAIRAPDPRDRRERE
ncbi:MAG TPA: hypothetical protein PKE29_01200 [Phycisphaerales bacterium]|nr:hypothetical protein [Phycisphaerales bacterium]